MWWLWMVAVSPLPGCQAEDPSQMGRNEELQKAHNGFDNETLQENQTERIWVTPNGTDLSREGWRTTPTPGFIPAGEIGSTQYEPTSPVPTPRFSSAKYWIPPAVVVVLLLGLFIMYRRKRGKESRSRAASINESSDSDTEDNLTGEQEAQLNPPHQTCKQIPEETLQTATGNDAEALGSQDQSLSEAGP